jgi:hypothetical protein
MVNQSSIELKWRNVPTKKLAKKEEIFGPPCFESLITKLRNYFGEKNNWHQFGLKNY